MPPYYMEMDIMTFFSCFFQYKYSLIKSFFCPNIEEGLTNPIIPKSLGAKSLANILSLPR